MTQLFTTRFLNFVASRGLWGRKSHLVRGIECCQCKLNPACSGCWCCANLPKQKLLVANSVFSLSCDEPEVSLAEVPCSPYYQKWLWSCPLNTQTCWALWKIKPLVSKLVTQLVVPLTILSLFSVVQHYILKTLVMPPKQNCIIG